MKVFFAVFFVLTLFLTEDLQAGGYDYQPLEEMIAGVEVILIAQVELVDPPYIMVNVSEVLAGSAKKSQIKLTYFLPEIWDGDNTYYWLLPGSGLEIDLKPGHTYIFLLTKTKVKGEYTLERAEEIARKEAVMEAWKKGKPKPKGGEKKELSVVELPRPNSGTFTFEQAEARKAEIYSLCTSGMMPEWKNSYWGFSVHINKADEIIVYNSFMGEGKMSVEELAVLLKKYGDLLEGNPLGVLITSEEKPDQSKVFSVVLELVFKPYVQVFYRIGI